MLCDNPIEGDGLGRTITISASGVLDSLCLYETLGLSQDGDLIRIGTAAMDIGVELEGKYTGRIVLHTLVDAEQLAEECRYFLTTYEKEFS